MARWLSGLFKRAPQAAVQEKGGGVIVSIDDLKDLLRVGSETASGAVVTPESAMRVAAVYACIRIISEAVAQLPLKLYRRAGETRDLADDHPLYPILSDRPNQYQTAYEFWQMLIGHACTRGNGYAYVSRSQMRGRVLELIPLHPSRVDVEQKEDLTLEYTWHRKDGQSVKLTGGRGGDILHLRGLTTNGVVGLSPIAAAREAIGLAMQTERHGATLFRNGARIGGVLKAPAGRALSEEAQKRLREQLEEKYTGADNAHKWMVLEDGLEAESIAMSSEDAQFLETRKFQRSDIAMFFGVPPHMLGDVEKVTSWGQGIEQQGIGFLQYTLNPWLVRIEQAIQRDLLAQDEVGTVYPKHNVDALLRADFKTRQEGLQIQRQNGVINADEWRRLEEMNPRTGDGGGDYIIPANMMVQSNASGGRDET